ncbi:MYND-type domain-containing protein [Mycena sanguinolenta]|uniref:MYND-type domain-containing protein n=1 Tax=Mycena sanguinolenta TaxID=230812 RepID=A0A8H6YT06_9AGAR|nr:MYND-type domain-containing protein [Mycena sanguinolenta]
MASASDCTPKTPRRTRILTLATAVHPSVRQLRQVVDDDPSVLQRSPRFSRPSHSTCIQYEDFLARAAKECQCRQSISTGPDEVLEYGTTSMGIRGVTKYSNGNETDDAPPGTMHHTCGVVLFPSRRHEHPRSPSFDGSRPSISPTPPGHSDVIETARSSSQDLFGSSRAERYGAHDIRLGVSWGVLSCSRRWALDEQKGDRDVTKCDNTASVFLDTILQAINIATAKFEASCTEVPTEKGLYQELFNQALHGFLRLSVLNSSYTGVVEVVNAGILPLIASVMGRNLEWTKTGIRGMMKFLAQPATVYYAVLAALERALPLAQRSISTRASKSALYADWREFLRIVLDRLDVKRKVDSGEHIAYKACDNLARGRILKKTDFKRCAGCVYQHYCSTECQIKDWRTSHRELCQQIRLSTPAGDISRSNWRVAIEVHPIGSEDQNEDHFARAKRSNRRVHPTVVLLMDGRTQAEHWLLPIRSSASEVHDRLFQLSQGIPRETDPTSNLDPAVYRTVMELVATVCPRVQEIV